jgi:hypothetical protein
VSEHLNDTFADIRTIMKRFTSSVLIRGACSLAFCIMVAMPGVAGTLSLQLPLDCDVVKTCPIQNHFDHDAGPGFRDHACGPLGYDGHDGVDIRLPNLALMRHGVPVVAAAPGVVRAVRDQMDDVSVKEIGRDAIKGREAGNGVVISHGEGWETQYSHLRKGSVKVKRGDHVQVGQVLGLVGLSGNTEFPHLHFSVRYQGQPIDPFAGLGRNEQCGTGNRPLWSDQALEMLAYRPTGMLQSGFAPQAPQLKDVEQGEYAASEFDRNIPALTFWVEVYGPQEGDQGLLQLFGPDGSVLAENKETFSKNKARWFGYVGKKRPKGNWPAGAYRGRYQLFRETAGQPTVVIDTDRVLIVR